MGKILIYSKIDNQIDKAVPITHTLCLLFFNIVEAMLLWLDEYYGKYKKYIEKEAKIIFKSTVRYFNISPKMMCCSLIHLEIFKIYLSLEK